MVEPSKIIFLCKILYPKGGYNLTLYWVPYGTIISPNKMLLIWGREIHKSPRP